MKNHILKGLAFFLFLHINYNAKAQCLPTDDCSDACFMGLSMLNGLSSSTNSFAPGYTPQICGTSDNDLWVKVQAAGTVGTVTVTPSNCVVGNGLQLALFNGCEGDMVACNVGCTGCGNKELTITANLSPTAFYYLWIDGWAGDGCDFKVKATGFRENMILSESEPTPKTAMPELIVLPNPFIEKAVVQLSTLPAGQKWLNLATPDGRICQRISFDDGTAEIFRTGLPKGLLFLWVELNGATIATGKLVVE